MRKMINVLRIWKSKGDGNLYKLFVDGNQLFISINDKTLIGPAQYIEDFNRVVDDVSKKYPDFPRFLCLLRLSKVCEAYLYKPEIILDIRKGNHSLVIRKERSGYTLILDGALGPRVDSLDDAVKVLSSDSSFKHWLDLILKAKLVVSR